MYIMYVAVYTPQHPHTLPAPVTPALAFVCDPDAISTCETTSDQTLLNAAWLGDAIKVKQCLVS